MFRAEPRSEEPTTEGSERRRERPKRTPRALVADDEVDDRVTIRRVLVQAGFDVDEADNGRRALELIQQTDYDLIVLDILMPQLDGFEVLRHLNSRDPAVLLRTVVVSRMNLTDMRVFFPLCQVLEKPLDRTDLATIARIIRNLGGETEQ